MIIETIQAAFDMGFKKVNFNIGSLTNEEINRLYNIFKDKYKDKLCLSLFQETYDINAYHSFLVMKYQVFLNLIIILDYQHQKDGSQKVLKG